MPNASTAEKKNSSKKLLILILILLLIFALLMGGVLYYFMVYQPAQRKKAIGGQREASALQGALEIMTDEEIEEALNNIIEEGMFRISIASEIITTESGEAQVRIQNHISNRYVMQVSIYLQETGEEIYSTDLIDPGYYIQYANFKRKLKPGEYEALAVFTALYPDTEDVVGTAGAAVKIYVLPKGATPVPTATPTATPTVTPTVTPTAAK